MNFNNEMVKRHDFLKNIKNTTTENNVVNLFDEIMALYDIIGHIGNINVISNNIGDNISFDIVLPDINTCINLKNIIDRFEVSKYGNIFVTNNTIVNNNILNISLIKRVSA